MEATEPSTVTAVVAPAARLPTFTVSVLPVTDAAPPLAEPYTNPAGKVFMTVTPVALEGPRSLIVSV